MVALLEAVALIQFVTAKIVPRTANNARLGDLGVADDAGHDLAVALIGPVLTRRARCPAATSGPSTGVKPRGPGWQPGDSRRILGRMTAHRQFDYIEVVGIAAIVGTILLCAVVLYSFGQ